MSTPTYPVRSGLVPERPELGSGDAKFFDRLESFSYGQLPVDSQLDDRTRALTFLAVLIGMGAEREYVRVLPKALDLGFAAEGAKEVTYQAAAYLGTGRSLPFLARTNQLFAELGTVVSDGLRLGSTPEFRREAGTAHQIEPWGVADFCMRSHMNYFGLHAHLWRLVCSRGPHDRRAGARHLLLPLCHGRRGPRARRVRRGQPRCGQQCRAARGRHLPEHPLPGASPQPGRARRA